MLTLVAIDEDLTLEVVQPALVDVCAFYNDIEMPLLQRPQPGSFLAMIVDPDTISLGGAPAANFIRQFKSVYVVNRHASAAPTVIFKKRKGVKSYQLARFTLAAGEHVNYIEGRGFTLYDTNGIPQLPA